MTAFLAIDAGTTGTKVAIIDATGAILSSAYRDYPCQQPRPGWVEQDVTQLWDAEVDAIRAVIAGAPVEISAIACSAQRATWVPIDQHGAALTPFMGWQDSRGLDDCDRIVRAVGPEYITRTGMTLDHISSVSKIVWFQRESPELAKESACFGAHETMLLRQLGVDDFIVSASEASYMGLLDVRSRQWDTDLASELGIDVVRLPRIVESGVPVGALSTQVAEQIGLTAGLPIVTGGGDLQLGVFGVGAVSRGRVAVGIGTGGGCMASAPEPLPDPEGRLNCLAHVVPGWWEVEGLGSAAGGSFRWFKDAFGDAEAVLAEEAGSDVYDLLTAQIPDQPTGLVVVPALAGLGAPDRDPRFSGAVVGLRLDHRRGDVIRAFMEGITFEQHAILDAMIATVGLVTEIRTWGGAAKSDVWCQIQADVYGLPVSRCREADASMLGAAMCAAIGVGAMPSAEEAMAQMSATTRTWSPRPKSVEAYRRHYEIYDQAVHLLRSSGLSDKIFALRGSL